MEGIKEEDADKGKLVNPISENPNKVKTFKDQALLIKGAKKAAPFKQMKGSRSLSVLQRPQ
jgi:hypothetical protein